VFCCALQDCWPVKIVDHKRNIRTVTPQNEFAGDLLTPVYDENTFHIRRTGISGCANSYASLGRSWLNNVCHTEHMNATFCCYVFECGPSMIR